MLSRVIDCRDLDALQLAADALFHDLDYRAGQELAAAVRAAGGEGLLIPSASRFPDDILIVFPDRLEPQSNMAVIEAVDPVLYVPRPGE